MATRLQGKIVLIAGASTGIGRATALAVVREGGSVVLADTDIGQQPITAELGTSALAVSCELTCEDDVQHVIATANNHFGSLDVLCNILGFGGPMAPLHDQSTEIWDKVHTANLKTTFLFMKHAISSMLTTGGGAIVNTASAAGVVGWKHHSVYGAAKAGVALLTKAAAIDYAAHNIRVNAIAPGTIWGGFASAPTSHATPPVGFPALPGIPMGKWGQPQDIANAVAFLASDEAAYITGVILSIDGGYSIGFSGMGAERAISA